MKAVYLFCSVLLAVAFRVQAVPLTESCRDKATNCVELAHLCNYPKDDPDANRIKANCPFTCGTCKSSWLSCTDSSDSALLHAYRDVWPGSISIPTCEGWARLCSIQDGARTALLVRAFCPMTCGSCIRDECFADHKARDYRGTISVTISGKTCQKWTSQQPHKHVRTPGNFPGTGLGDHNFCRNPDLELTGAWCYTTDNSTRWELCDVGQPLACD
ncbi:inactive tyrosine-protein kinase transmembrane receptor ROR1-like [Amphiura filiformis]|uniref:inactive tyrosine-protein kinase transmembrane receptor ROR1-like n=1 Tax=Amphiura filiformis TaxID=82378 RepID=UPI003B20BF75